jgi:glycosyltransferase involved in cell wall biosynthesis
MSTTKPDTAFIAQPFFSIIIPTFNRPEMLGRALESVIQQGFENLEIIIVDDCSSVPYDAIIEKYNSVITTYLRNSVTSGVSIARNRGIFLAKGVWTIFLDDDDEFERGYLLYLYDYIKENKLEMAFLWSSIKICQYDPDGKLIDILTISFVEKPRNIEGIIHDALSIGASYGLVVATAAFYRVGLFDSLLLVGEDTEFLIRLLINGIAPHPLSKVGVVKHNHIENRLSFGHEKYSNTCAYEKIFYRHRDFLITVPNTYRHLLHWSAIIHYENKNYLYGNNALWRMLLVRPITISSFEFYIGGKLVMLSVRIPILKKSIDKFFNFYDKLF